MVPQLGRRVKVGVSLFIGFFNMVKTAILVDYRLHRPGLGGRRVQLLQGPRTRTAVK